MHKRGGEKQHVGVLKFKLISPTKEPDDIRVIEVFHACRLIQELFDLSLRETIHYE